MNRAIRYEDVKKALHAHANEKNRIVLQRFFKTAKGEYGHGDQFIGVKVVQTRLVVRRYREAPLPVLKRLIQSKIHEERALAIMIVRDQYERAAKREEIATLKLLLRFLITHRKRINNWDLVDSMAPYVTGHYWFHHLGAGERKRTLYSLIRSKSLWDRRIAMISTYYFIRQKHFDETLALAQHLLTDEEDLMHKAAGWMLREMGKRDVSVLKQFLNRHAYRMPRTMLRYSIEKLTPQERERFLGLKAGA